MDHIQNRPMDARSDIVAKENVNPLPMLKAFLVSGVAASAAAALASPASAGSLYFSTLSSTPQRVLTMV